MLVFYWALALFMAISCAFKPQISSTQFDKGSKRIIYFDDSPTILNLNDNRLHKSSDNGVSWKDITSTLDKDAKISTLVLDQTRKDRVFAIGSSRKHYFTSDKGNTWKSFEFDVDFKPSMRLLISENINNKKNVLLNLLDCADIFTCTPSYYYTNDEFATPPKKIELDDLVFCSFTSTKSNADLDDDDHVLCVLNVYDNHQRVKSTVIHSSSDWFKTSTIITDGNLSDTIVYDLQVVESFIVIKAFSDRYSGQSYVDLYVSRDGKSFKKAHFPGDLKSESFVILPSNDHSLYVSVWGFKKKMTPNLSTVVSDLYISDSEGFTFRKLDSLSEAKDFYGFHSIEKISNLDGVWLSNVMTGYDGFSFFPIVKSMMSFDDGRSWEYLKYKIDENGKTKTYCENKESCHLNLLNAIEMTGDGNFESGPTPGILVGVGSVSETQLFEYNKLSTWISRDGGYTWEVAIDKPCVFSIGDQGNVIVAIPFHSKYKMEASVDRSLYYYSLDQGKTWQEEHFDKKILPTLLTTTIDGSSTKFIFSGYDFEEAAKDKNKSKFYVYAMDFSNAFGGKKCGSGDMEEFVARKEDANSKAVCIMGHKEKFMRRKQDAKCFVNKLYEDVKPIDEPCACTKADFECHNGFTTNEQGECVPDFKYFRQVCTNNENLESRVPKRALIPGNTCDESSGDSYKLDLEKDYFDLKCQDVLKDSASADIRSSRNALSGTVDQYVYLDQSKTDYKDETVVVLTSTKRVYISHNGGLEFFWASVNEEEVLAIIENKYNGNHVVLLTPSDSMYVSIDRAQTFVQIKTPTPVNGFGYAPLIFHPNNTDTFIFVGSENCESNTYSSNCHSSAFLTTDGGNTWNNLLDNARNCDFAGARFKTDDKLIFCEQLNSDGSVKVLGSTNLFKDSEVHFEKAVGIAPDDTFMIVAEIVDDSTALKSLTTVNGKTWAHAKFPHDFQVDKEQAYTIIRSNSRSIYLHVTTSNRKGSEFGSILKSNSNGTSYILSENYVNRDSAGYVDFEKVEGIEGLAIINVVTNPKEALTGASKKLKTKITHNDAAEWAFINPPSVNSKGEKYPCMASGQSLEECSLNLHGFTERIDYRDTYSSGSAVGMMIGVGNVGSELLEEKACSTFLTRDGGITWKEIHEKPLAWEYGDQGSILVLVDQNAETNTLLYSLDEGENWSEYEFYAQKVKVNDIATIPSDTSRRFVIFASQPTNKDHYSLALGVDFSGVYARQCTLDLDNLDLISKDFEYWTPKHPFLPDNCLFGHEARYLRRKLDRTDCYVGSAPLNEAYKVLRNCSCSRKDFECDYNFARASDGTCKLVNGLSPKDPKEVCVNKKVYEYFEPTGYRKIPLSTCEGGKQLDKWEAKPCPGKGDQFDDAHGSGLRGFNLFLVVFVPLSVFIFASWFVYDKGIRRNGGWTQFGQIRLEENNDFESQFPNRVENTLIDKIVNRIVDVGVFAFVGSVAVAQYFGKLRDKLANRRRGGASLGRYTTVNQNQAFLDDEDELLGSDDENDNADEEDNFISNTDQFDDDARSLGTMNEDDLRA